MKKFNISTGAIVLLMLFTSSDLSKFSFERESRSDHEGYITILRSREGFIAASSNGRIDWISDSGKITGSEQLPVGKLQCLLDLDDQIIAAADNKTLLIGSRNESFREFDFGRDANIYSLALFNDKIIAGSDGGEIIIGDKTGRLKKIQLELEGNIISLSSNKKVLYAVSDLGEIIHSFDGEDWEIFDFNKTYAGYYKSCQFKKILVCDNRIAIFGQEQDGLPVLYFSSRGSVWTKRNLVFTGDDGMMNYLKDVPNDMFYDRMQDRFILVCDNGRLMTIPSCEHCNKTFLISSENLTGIAGNEKSLIVVGEHGFLKKIELESDYLQYMN